MSNPTTPFSWQMPTATDLVTDLPADFEVFGQAVATSMADLLGGTTGQVLSKTTDADMDFTWVAANPGDITGVTAGVGISGGGTSGTVTVTNDMATTITASGDIVVGTGSGTYDNLPIGTTGQLLTADTTVSPYKVKWATPTVAGFVGARVYKSAAQSITTATFTEVSWNLEVFDTDGFHDNATNNNRFTIPAGKAGYYRIEYSIGPYNTNENYYKLMKNGSAVESADYAQVAGTTGNVWFSYVARLAVADYISFQYAQYTGGNRNINASGASYAQIQYLGA
jgi:hypothetical protein